MRCSLWSWNPAKNLHVLCKVALHNVDEFFILSCQALWYCGGSFLFPWKLYVLICRNMSSGLVILVQCPRFNETIYFWHNWIEQLIYLTASNRCWLHSCDLVNQHFYFDIISVIVLCSNKHAAMRQKRRLDMLNIPTPHTKTCMPYIRGTLH